MDGLFKTAKEAWLAGKEDEVGDCLIELLTLVASCEKNSSDETFKVLQHIQGKMLKFLKHRRSQHKEMGKHERLKVTQQVKQ